MFSPSWIREPPGWLQRKQTSTDTAFTKFAVLRETWLEVRACWLSATNCKTSFVVSNISSSRRTIVTEYSTYVDHALYEAQQAVLLRLSDGAFSMYKTPSSNII